MHNRISNYLYVHRCTAMRLRNVRAHRMGEMCARAKHTGNPLALSLHDFRMVTSVYIHRGPKFAIRVNSKEMLRVEIKKKSRKTRLHWTRSVWRKFSFLWLLPIESYRFAFDYEFSITMYMYCLCTWVSFIASCTGVRVRGNASVRARWRRQSIFISYREFCPFV